ncbi:MAG TPA: cell envelope integrity protein TolA [Xanthomonadaceae bacterium]|nr:cell envelope integrity protein TolA [Xanthomonadaceae bacterium]
MRETRTDTTLAVVVALALHALILLALLFGLHWTRPQPDAAAGEPVLADLVDPDALGPAARRALANPKPAPEPPPEPEPEAQPPPPQPEPAPVPEDAPVPRQAAPQEQLARPDAVEQERVDRDAVSPDTAAREQEEKHRQQQVDLTEQKRRQEEAEQKKRLAEQAEAERQRKLEDIRRQRAALQRQMERDQQRQQQIRDYQARKAAEASAQADAIANAQSGNRGSANDLLNQYRAAIQAAVVQNWRRPESVPLGQICKIVIRQLPGGEVVDAKVDPSCPYDEAGRRSIEAAVLKAQPLPYAGFEPVFNRTLNFNFEARDR